METFPALWQPLRRMKARDLPIRDGNVLQGPQAIGKSLARDLPIRDGNALRRVLAYFSGLRPRPSYKGWKRRGTPSAIILSLARDLPIRDGNISLKETCKIVLEARDLPIRDGNWRAVISHAARRSARDLPIRDGNSMEGHHFTFHLTPATFL